jgi:hypothetical protein
MWQLLGRVEKNQNGGRCHGKQGIKWPTNTKFLGFWVFFVAMAAILKFLSLKIMCTHVRQNFWKVSSNSEHHSKPTMNINSQHHNLLNFKMPAIAMETTNTLNLTQR